MRRILLTLTLLLIAAPVVADFGPPVSVGLLGEPRAAREGELYHGTFFVHASAEITLSDFRLEGDGWRAAIMKAPTVVQAARGERLVYEFSVLPVDPEQPLIVAFEWNGHPYRKKLDLSEGHVRRLLEGGPALPVTAVLPIPAGSREPSPGPEPAAPSLTEAFWQAKRAGLTPDPQDIETEDQVSKSAYTVTVEGRWIYWREDNFPIGADATTVEVYDFDYMSPPDRLAVTTTNIHGFFDMSFTWDSIDDPDLFVVFWSQNGKVDVEDETWPHGTYSWSTDIRHNYTGTDWDLGTLQPPEDSYPAIHILNGVTRTWRWFNNLGYNARDVDVWWPEGDDGASYNDGLEVIKISAERQWHESTQSHEYGHHWMNCFATIADPDYCNGFCDDGDDCGHCIWCRENEEDAWQEGFADYIGRVVPATYQAEYANWAMYLTGVANLDTCGVDNAIHDPDLTEGFIAAALVDIHDDSDDDHAIYPGYRDQLTMGSEEILSLVDELNPRAPLAFLMAFKDRNPSVHEDLWETAMNCGWDIDEWDPGLVTNLASLSHTIGVESANPEIWMIWTKPTDDASGVAGYSISFTEGAPSPPDTWRDIDDVIFAMSSPLGAGSWYFNIRAVDRAGNWDDHYTSAGPYLIRDPEPADLAYYSRAGWDYEVVPTSAADHTTTTAHVSATLPGYSSGTYYSVSGRNAGESATSQSIRGAVWVDGAYKDYNDYGVINAGQTFVKLNDGPITVNGGRHAFHYKLDSLNRISEPNEDNNYYGRQYVWTPQLMTVGTVYGMPPAPMWNAGWDYLKHGLVLFFNSDGFRFNSNGWWNAAVVWGVDEDDDYDAALHHPSTGAEDGFGGIIRHSGRGPGCLDALIVNRNTLGAQNWDVGVRNLWGDDSFDYQAVHLISATPYTVGHTYTVNLGLEEYLAVRELYVSADYVGPVSVYVQTDPPTSPLYLQWRDADYTYGTLSEADQEMATDADGCLHMMLDIADVDFTGLLLYRDPHDGGDPVTITVDVKVTPPDMKPFFTSGWHSPMVPRPADDGTTTIVALPDTLYGEVESTYYNVSLYNDSPSDAADVYANVQLDGLPETSLHYTLFYGGYSSRWNIPTPFTVRGGRHSLTLWIDADGIVEELSDDNNWYGEQYVWGPYRMYAGEASYRSAPPDRMGGWTEIGSGEPKWYNCDGLRMDPKSNHWIATAVMPASDCNVDVRIHEQLVGAKEGFASNLVYSGWGTGQLDYVLANFQDMPSRKLDVGVLRLSGTRNYVYECVRDVAFKSVPGTMGPITMNGYQVLDLYEVPLTPGRYEVYLEVGTGSGVDWGVTLHPHDVSFISKSLVVPGAAAWENGPDGDETFYVDIAEGGLYCLAVWKVGSSDVKLAGTYQITVRPDATAVEDGPPPAVTALRSVYPNPFNPRVNIAFDLAREETVEIAIYNAAGARVCTLLRERRPAGRHELCWDGVDDGGHRVASGVYHLQMRAGALHEHRKMVLLK